MSHVILLRLLPLLILAYGSSTLVLSQEEYDRLCQLEFSRKSHSATHAGMHVYTTSPQKPYILDLGVSSYVIGIKQNFILLNLSNTYPSIKIVDGTQSPV